MRLDSLQSIKNLKKTKKLIEWDSFVHPSEKMKETGQRKRQSKPWVANLKDKKKIVKKEREKESLEMHRKRVTRE